MVDMRKEIDDVLDQLDGDSEETDNAIAKWLEKVAVKPNDNNDKERLKSDKTVNDDLIVDEYNAKFKPKEPAMYDWYPVHSDEIHERYIALLKSCIERGKKATEKELNLIMYGSETMPTDVLY
jgi:hypothetical protein